MAISDTSIILDSSVWIAFFKQDDSQHQKAEGVLAQAPSAQVVVPEYVLVEVATALKQRGYQTAAKEFVAMVMHEGRSIFLPSDALARETSTCFCERSDKLSFTDTALLTLSREYRIITFDKALARAIVAEQRKLR